MRARPPSIFLWTPEYLFSRISGETFPCSYSWSCRSRRLYSLSRRYYLFGQDSQRGLRDTTSLSVFAFAARERSSPQLGDATLNTRSSTYCIQNNVPVSLSLSLPTAVVQSINFVEPRKTCDFPCNTSWDVRFCIRLNKILFYRYYPVVSPINLG